MGSSKQGIIRAGMEALYFSGMHLLMRPFVGGSGIVLTLHHVRPPRPDRFQPNRLLEVTPRFLEKVARRLRRSRLDVITLDEMHRRLTAGESGRRFVCVTIDDGYRDTMQCAYPILKKYEIPFTLYIPTSFPDRLGELWWLALEAVIAKNKRIGLVIDGEDRRFDCRTVHEKRRLYAELYAWLRRFDSEEEMRRVIRDLSERYQVDIAAFCTDLCMGWDELAALAADPLVTIGAHTVNHMMLKKLPEKAARKEMEMSRAVLEASLGVRPQHLAYPVGDKTSAGPREFRIAADLGFKTAVTTRPGVIFPRHREHLMALPRISLNGEFQRMRYLKVLMSGAATGLWNGFRPVSVT
ncbi:MAG TPA: polysaccharide deacetylase family protein [Xanthobacteraceae bacterium]|nr:polysaccharide deacetylase family protein [Xanthobacteraceae bacterium]